LLHSGGLASWYAFRPFVIVAEYGRLDILVNNAGIVDAADGPPSTAAAEAARRIMDTHLSAHWQ